MRRCIANCRRKSVIRTRCDDKRRQTNDGTNSSACLLYTSDITHEKLDKIFQYRVPSRLAGELSVGMEVFVPFGKWNRQTKGYVVGFSETCDYDLSKVKEIADISRDGIAIEGKLVALAAWMQEPVSYTHLDVYKRQLFVLFRST